MDEFEKAANEQEQVEAEEMNMNALAISDYQAGGQFDHFEQME